MQVDQITQEKWNYKIFYNYGILLWYTINTVFILRKQDIIKQESVKSPKQSKAIIERIYETYNFFWSINKYQTKLFIMLLKEVFES